MGRNGRRFTAADALADARCSDTPARQLVTSPATPVYCRGTRVAMSTAWWDGSTPTNVWPAGRGAAAVVGGRFGGAASSGLPESGSCTRPIISIGRDLCVCGRSPRGTARRWHGVAFRSVPTAAAVLLGCSHYLPTWHAKGKWHSNWTRQQTRPRSLTWALVMERVTRIELALSAWEAAVIWGPFGRSPRRMAAEPSNRAGMLSPWFPAAPRCIWCACGAGARPIAGEHRFGRRSLLHLDACEGRREQRRLTCPAPPECLELHGEGVYVVQDCFCEQQSIMCILPLYRYAGVVRSVVTETSQLLGPLKQATIKLPVGRELLERIYQWLRGRSLVVAETFEDPSDHDSRSSEGLAGEATASFFTLVAQLARNAEAELTTRRWVDPYGVRPASFEVIVLGHDQGPSATGLSHSGQWTTTGAVG
ncbi:hypothetical protein SAMN05444521_4245 [Streptomyces sp. 3214.6]|nr:hypothetical protein SAMN05444521_4245 [Streptomyces sp. 3214.6]